MTYDRSVLVDPPEDLGRHRRIVIHGVAGSGKSSLAVRLAATGGLTYVAVDDLMWRPGWVQVPRDEQADVLRPHAAGASWVMDALWTATREVVLPRTDLLVALDYPRRVSLGRLLNRTAHRRTLSRDSVVGWHVRSVERKRREVEQWSADPQGPPVLRFTDPRQTDAWLRRLEARAAA